jgi:hypothetical protein
MLEPIPEIGEFVGWQAYAIARRADGVPFAQIASEITDRFGIARNRQFVSEFLSKPGPRQAVDDLCLDVWDEIRGKALSRASTMMAAIGGLMDSEDPKFVVEGCKLNRQLMLDAIHAEAKRQVNEMQRAVARMANGGRDEKESVE